jgi:hypothetical protein
MNADTKAAKDIEWILLMYSGIKDTKEVHAAALSLCDAGYLMVKSKYEHIDQVIASKQTPDQHPCPMCRGSGKVGAIGRGSTKCAILMIMKRFGIKERQAYNMLKKTKDGK